VEHVKGVEIETAGIEEERVSEPQSGEQEPQRYTAKGVSTLRQIRVQWRSSAYEQLEK
jgi:hypothetical protein